MKIFGSWAAIISIIGSIGTATVYIKSELELIIATAINQHDHSYKDVKQGPSHSDLREANIKLVKELELVGEQQREDYNDLVMAYWYLIGYDAADMEPIRQLKAAAASYYRGEFLVKCKSSCSDLGVRRCKRDGKPYVQDVYRLVLGSNWVERERLVRALR